MVVYFAGRGRGGGENRGESYVPLLPVFFFLGGGEGGAVLIRRCRRVGLFLVGIVLTLSVVHLYLLWVFVYVCVRVCFPMG